MLRQERHDYILKKLNKLGKIETTILAKELKVTEDTIRKDLQALEKEELIERVYGGAFKRENILSNFQEREEQFSDEKEYMSNQIAGLLLQHKMIFIDSSTTNQAIAERLVSQYAGTIFTNSPTIALELAKGENIDVHLLGGKLNKERLSICDSQALKEIETMNIECTLLGTAAVSLEHGITNTDIEETIFKRELIVRSKKVVTAVVKNKLETDGPYFVGSLDDIDLLITNEQKFDILEKYKKIGIEVLSV